MVSALAAQARSLRFDLVTACFSFSSVDFTSHHCINKYFYLLVSHVKTDVDLGVSIYNFECSVIAISVTLSGKKMLV